MLCSLPAGKQHSGAFPNPVVECNRCIHQMVERKTCSKGEGTPGPLVPHSQPSESTEAVSMKVAPSSSGLPSSVPHAIFQDGLHQTCSCSRPTLQSQTGHRRLVDHPTGNMLLQKLGTFQSCCTQSIRPPLGLSRFPASSLHLRGLGGHCGRLLTQQSLPFQERIPQSAQTWASKLDKTQRPTFYANLRDLGSVPTSLDRTLKTSHMSHHQVIHQLLISTNL